MTKETETEEGLAEQAAEAARQFSWPGVVRITAEVSAIASILAFVLSCLINTFVFARWNHDFLQLATPADVIMSGMRIIGSMIAPISIAGVSVTIMFLYVSKSNDVERLINAIPAERRILRTVGKIVDNAALFGFVIIWTAMFLYVLVGSNRLPDTVDICIGLFLLTVGIAGLLEHFVWSKTDSKDGWLFLLVFWFYVIASLIFGAILTSRWLSDRVDAQSAVGFHREPLAVFHDGRDVCGGGSRLLWSGNQSSLVECPTGGPSRVVMVLRDGENIDFVPHGYVAEWRARGAEGVRR